MTKYLSVFVPDGSSDKPQKKRPFCSIYTSGLHIEQVHLYNHHATRFSYLPNAVVFLYYTYPNFREACVIRNTPDGNVPLPGLSKKVSLLFTAPASLRDKVFRAELFLRAHCSPGPYDRDDGFYVRLCLLLRQKGKVNYQALKQLADYSAAHKPFKECYHAYPN